MGQSIDIDFSKLKPLDPVGDYVNAFKVGQSLKAQAGSNAFAPQPPATAVPPAADPPSPEWLQSLGGAQRLQASQQAEILGTLGQGLANLPYASRGAVLAHLAPVLAARGLPPAAIAAFDPTDANLAEITASARQMQDQLGG